MEGRKEWKEGLEGRNGMGWKERWKERRKEMKSGERGSGDSELKSHLLLSTFVIRFLLHEDIA